MKKTFGILLALISFVFLVWFNLSFLHYSFVVRMLVNAVGFVGFSGGLYLAGVSDLLHLGKPKEPYERREAIKTHNEELTAEAQRNAEKKKTQTELKKFEEEDHDRFMPR